MEYVASSLGSMIVVVYFFIVVGIPILLIISPIMIWLNIRRCATALERMVALLETPRTKTKSSAVPPLRYNHPVQAQEQEWLDKINS